MKATLAEPIELEAAERALLEAGRSETGAHRIATLNLLARANDDEDAQRLSAELDTLLRSYPARVLVITPNLTPEPAWRARLLHLGERESNGSVHAEILQLRGGRAEDAAAAAMPLLRGGLPVCLWWRGATPIAAPGFEALAHLAERVVYDSDELGKQAEAWRALSQQMRAQMRAQNNPCVTIDLVWPRLTRWRRLLAQTADGPQGARLWAGLDRVRFQACASQPAMNAAALMLTGWLSSRLGWKCLRRPAPERFLFRTTADGELQLEFMTENYGRPDTVLYGLQLENTRAGMSLHIGREGDRLKAELRRGGEVLGRIAGEFPRTDALAALAQELQLCLPDQLYDEAQAAALRLLELPVQA